MYKEIKAWMILQLIFELYVKMWCQVTFDSFPSAQNSCNTLERLSWVRSSGCQEREKRKRNWDILWGGGLRRLFSYPNFSRKLLVVRRKCKKCSCNRP